MKTITPVMSFPVILAILCGCSSGNGGGVQVFEIDSGDVVGGTTLSPFQRYRDMVIGIDDVHGQIAAIEWGDRTSTVKIITLKPWKVSKYSVAATHVQGSIEGPMSFDFQNNRFFYVTDMDAKSKMPALVGIGLKDGKQQRYPAIAHRGAWISGPIASTADGLFFRVVGEKEAWLCQIPSNAGSAKEIFHTNDVLRKWGISGQYLYWLTTPRDSKSDARLVLVDRSNSTKTEHILSWSALEYVTDGEHLMSFFPDNKALRRISITSPDRSQDFKVPPPKDGFRISTYTLACSQNHALLTENAPDSPVTKLVMLDLRTGKTRERDITGYQSPILTFRYDGKNYAILAE